MWLADTGITTGCAQDPPGYCPRQPVTRAQMASFLARALDLAPPEQPAGFGDVDAGGVHAGNIERMHAAGVSAGCRRAPLEFCGDEPVTRAQMAAFLYRARNLIAAAE